LVCSSFNYENARLKKKPADFRLPPWCRWDLWLRISFSVWWYYLTDVLGQPFGPIFKGQEIQEFDFLTLDNGTDRVSRNISKELAPYAA